MNQTTDEGTSALGIDSIANELSEKQIKAGFINYQGEPIDDLKNASKPINENNDIGEKSINENETKEENKRKTTSSQIQNNNKRSKRKNPPRRKIIKHPCYECGKDFENEHLLKVHSESCNVATDSESELQIKIEVESEPEMDREQPTKVKKKSKGKGRQYTCQLCQETFARAIVLKQHQIDKHNFNLYSCSICTLSFPTARECSQHIVSHGEEKPFECDKCGKKYVLRESLNRHYKVHDANKAFVCNICGKAFAEKLSWSRHQHIHTGEKPFACKVCGLAFRDPSTMRKHQMRHNEDKPFSCEHCDKKFASNYDLKKHSIIHIKNEDRQYQCMYCGKGFYLSNQFRTHLRMHTGDKPFRCDICQKGFTDHCNLSAHKQSHFSKDVECLKCGAKFRWQCNLVRHLKKVHADDHGKPFKCDLCEKTFGDESSLMGHIKQQHKNFTSTEGDNGLENVQSENEESLSENDEMNEDEITLEEKGEDENFDTPFKKAKISNNTETENMASRNFTCQMCNEKFQQRFLLYQHIKQNHEKRVPQSFPTLNNDQQVQGQSCRNDEDLLNKVIEEEVRKSLNSFNYNVNNDKTFMGDSYSNNTVNTHVSQNLGHGANTSMGMHVGHNYV